MTFSALRYLHVMEEKVLPDANRDERALVVVLAAAEEEGKPLTMKQLLQVCSDSAPTLRRRVRRLIDLGYVTKKPVQGDGRREAITVTRRVWSRAWAVEVEIKKSCSCKGLS